MENTVSVAKNLENAWRILGDEIRKSKNLKRDLFIDTFSETYQLLSKYINENSVDKNCLKVIAEAFSFAAVKDKTLDNSCLAAFVLTDRMLDYCVFCNTPTVQPSVYIVELRREMTLDFNDVRKTMCALTESFNEIYLKNLFEGCVSDGV